MSAFGWEISSKFRILSGDGLTFTAQLAYYATKDCESVVLEAPTPDALVELILMREGISVERFYNSIGTVSAP